MKQQIAATIDSATAGPSQAAEQLANRIDNRSANVAVIGLGYAGLPVAIEFARAGFTVTGIDIDPSRVALVNGGHSPVSDVSNADVRDLLERGRLRASAGIDTLACADVVFICVPTPLTADRDANLGYVRSAARSIAMHLHPGMLVILQSTCSPGTTRGVLLPILQEGSTLVAGQDFFVAFAPERIDPGNRRFTIRNTPKVVGGLTPVCTDLAMRVFAPVIERLVPVSSPDAAEVTKLMENAFRFVNISFVNEMAMVCEQLGVDICEVIDAAATKPFGFMAHYPGPGIGGDCIPIVPFFLEAAARKHGLNSRMIAAAGEINSEMPSIVADRIEQLLNGAGKPLAGARVLLLGAAYKADTDDPRESPTLPVMAQLRERGAKVVYYDHHVPSVRYEGVDYFSLTEDEVTSSDFDCLVLLTPHTDVDYATIAQRAGVFFDTHGRHVPPCGANPAATREAPHD
jgi:UDP-N-acetyl-D-glucosamine dehydrogenase